MIVNADNLTRLYTGYKAVFQAAFDGAPSTYNRIAMRVPSGTRQEEYGWFGEWPNLREWVGDRVVKNLTAQSYTIKNRKFEHTVALKRDDISDDRIGIFAAYFAEMGRLSKFHPDELVYDLLASGFTVPCYDGQNFFDTDHPVVGADGALSSVSNMQAGSGPAWFLIDGSRSVRPVVFQEREAYQLQTLNNESDTNVFLRDEYLYGVRARVNAGFGLWQLAFGSKADLTPENYAAARAAMMAFKGDGGRRLGVTPNILALPASLESKGRAIVKSGSRIVEPAEGSFVAVTNEWADTAELIVTPYLD